MEDPQENPSSRTQRDVPVLSYGRPHRNSSTRIPTYQHTDNSPRDHLRSNRAGNLSRLGTQQSTRRPPRHQPPRQPFSLAGSRIPPNHGGSYIDPDYHEYNPRYQKDFNTPLWGLAKPLPRVVRQGMRRGRSHAGQGTVEDTEAEIEEPGDSEAIPQLGMISDQRADVGKDAVGQREESRERGYGHHRTNTGGTAQKVKSNGTVVDPNSSPLYERGNPMEQWGDCAVPKQGSDPFDDRAGDLGDRCMNRLSSVKEEPSEPVSNSSFASFEGHRAIVDPADIDLEAGEKFDEWPVEDGEEEQYLDEERNMHNSWAEFRARYREPLAECLAVSSHLHFSSCNKTNIMQTMVAVLLGLCTNLAVQTSNETSGIYLSSNWAWGLGVTIGIYIAGGISGAHLNPAISLILCLYRGFPFRKAMVYITAQVFGAFLAGIIAYGVYKDAIGAFNTTGGSVGADGGSASPVGLSAGGTGTSFFSQPAAFAGVGTGFANEFVATAILACAILALGDDSNAPPGAGMHALIVGLLVTVLSMAFGYNTGPCLNPARDFGPRIAAAVVGYGGEVFTVENAWWIYGAWGGTVSGGLVGGLFYDAAIFVGGESPVNYPRGKRRVIKRKTADGAKRSWWRFKQTIA